MLPAVWIERWIGQGARRVGKMEDFEKLRELSAHMDHVVGLLARCFPLEGGDHLDIRDAASATPGFHPAPRREGRGQARANAEDRAACLGREITGRAVSANRTLQLDSGWTMMGEAVTASICSCIGRQFYARAESRWLS